MRHDRNRGLHGALDTGFRAALARTGAGDWVLTMDADDTHPPNLISAMLEKGRAGADVVIASRFQPGAQWFGLSWDRLLFSKGVSWLFRILWPMPNVRDYTCGYRLYRADLLRRAYETYGDAFVSEPSFACMPDVLWKVSRLRPAFAEVPLSLHYDRKPGASKMNVRSHHPAHVGVDREAAPAPVLSQVRASEVTALYAVVHSSYISCCPFRCSVRHTTNAKNKP